ncbi:hypothetical protein QBC47DRAFT_358312 [Echria macrotheca]|uniref:Uncharacterized protein n=1 Tax=Echria macrotheca TaxID=438768 RepID=A0AAJ0BJT9_9PEZI|nr:hypothetical protein QBC47DRAFT_358312 [Echria macrotheca]
MTGESETCQVGVAAKNVIRKTVQSPSRSLAQVDRLSYASQSVTLPAGVSQDPGPVRTFSPRQLWDEKPYRLAHKPLSNQHFLVVFSEEMLHRGQDTSGTAHAAAVGVQRPAVAQVPSTAAEKSRQPTYTTVGSIYNPNASAPLQPPTRRPRARRYQPVLQLPPQEHHLLSGQLVPVFPMRDKLSPEPLTASPGVPEYSPLQQNYDRAISPLAEQEKAAWERRVAMAAPSMRSGNMPAPPGLSRSIQSPGSGYLSPPPALDYSSPSPGIGGPVGDGGNRSRMPVGDGDSVASEDTLASKITVKGLTNLASYPNPMQRAAQNALAKARAANHAASRAATPSLSLGADSGRDRMTGPGSTAMGIPQPLTAGPPGQRHFRPTTSDATLRAVNTNNENAPPHAFQRMDDVPPSPFSREPFAYPSSHSQRPFPGVEPSGQANIMDRFGQGRQTPQMAEAFNFSHSSTFQMARESPGWSTTDAATPNGKVEEKGKGALPGPTNEARQGSTNVALQSLTTSRDVVVTGSSDMAAKSQPTPAQAAEEALTDRAAWLDQWFYGGTHRLDKDVGTVVREHENRCLKNKFGVIGDGRDLPRQDVDTGTKDNAKRQPRVPSMEETKATPDHVHAEPLVVMLLETLLRHKENSIGVSQPGFPRRYVPADPAWIDNSPGGNNSFFDQPADEQSKKKKLPKKARRGY